MVVAGGTTENEQQSVVWLDADKQELVLKLRRCGICIFGATAALVVLACRRKNKPGGSKLTRKCWCKECPRTCPVHVMGRLVESCAPGEALFGGITAHGALDKLRFMLAAVGVENPQLYRSHDIRRGHALDLQCSGGRSVA